MKRTVLYVVGVLVVLALMCVPLLGIGSGDSSAGASTETATITDYDAKFVVDRAGTLRATETLQVSFPVYKHGIFRFFDLADPLDDHVRFVPRDISVTRDGQKDGLDLSHEGGGRYVVARIGDPDRTLDGQHTYVIRYTVRGALSAAQASSGGQSLFFWNLIPGGWQMPITKATLSATLPRAPERVRCAIGVRTTDGCTADVSGDTLRVTTGALAPNTPVTVQAGVPIGQPAQTRVPWGLSLDPVLGRSWPLVVLFVLLSLAALVAGLVLARSVREADPAYPLMYEPPEDIGPAQGAYLITERVNDDAYAATMLQLGEKGVATIEHQGEAWRITGLPGDWDGLDEVTRRTAEEIGVAPGKTFTSKPADVADGQEIQLARRAFDGEVRAWATKAGLVQVEARARIGRVAVIGSAVVAGFLFIANFFGFSLSGLPFGLFAVMALPLLDPRASTQRTPAGREVWSRIGGFRRVLGTTSSEARFDFSGRQELYLQYVPWAVAFGVADVWAQKYRIEVQQEPPVPTYFAGGYLMGSGPSANPMSGFSDSFNGSVGAAISAYQATQSHSSSGGGGGGFSGGGGGGGGGGGSW